MGEAMCKQAFRKIFLGDGHPTGRSSGDDVSRNKGGVETMRCREEKVEKNVHVIRVQGQR